MESPGTKGDLAALSAAIFASLYLIMGRSVRDRIPIVYWLFAVYSCAALLLGFAACSASLAITLEQMPSTS